MGNFYPDAGVEGSEKTMWLCTFPGEKSPTCHVDGELMTPGIFNHILSASHLCLYLSVPQSLALFLLDR